MNFEHLIDGGLILHNSRSNAITITHLDGTETETKNFVSFVRVKVSKLGGLHTPNANIHLGFIQIRNMDIQDITKALLSRINQIYY